MTKKCIDDYNISPYILMIIVIQLLIVIQIWISNKITEC